MMPGRGKRSPIGLDIGSRRIKAAQVSRTGDGPRLEAALSIRRTDSGPVLTELEAEQLGAALFRAGFTGGALAAAVPSELLIDTSAELPPKSSRAPMAQIAAGELARVGRVPAESVVCAHWLTATSAGSGPTPARIVGAERTRLDELLDSLERLEAGAGPVTPLALDTASWATVRFVAPWLGAYDDVTLVADIGWRRCALSIVCGRRIVYERAVPGLGVESLHQSISRDLPASGQTIDRLLERLDDDDAPEAAARVATSALHRQSEQVAEEVERSLRFATELGAAGRLQIILAGGGATRRFTDQVAACLEGVAEVRRAEPGRLLAHAGGAAAEDSALACAIGLALRMDR